MRTKTGITSQHLTFVSSGLCPNCEDCMNLYGYSYDETEKFNNAVENQDILDEGSFSWNPCDDCNTNLGGTYYLAHGRDENDDLIHFRVCVDCLFEIQ